MYLSRKKNYLYVVVFGLFLNSSLALALEFQPTIGAVVRFTDNARLTLDDKISDIVTTGNVGASLAESEGPLVYDTSVSLRQESYVKDTFADKRYFTLGAHANWELLKDRHNLYLADDFAQRAVNSLDADTPDNRQNSNVFIFGANLNFPITASQKFSLLPEYNQYYYEKAITNNRQYSLAANWNYRMFRLTNLGLNLSARKIKYDDESIVDTTFSDLGFSVSGQRAHSNYSINLGATNVKRDTAKSVNGATDSSEGTGFTGNVNWRVELSTRSSIDALVLTEITDTSKVSQITSPGNPDDVQLTTDVIRNSIIRLNYFRSDAVLNTNIWGEYRKLRHSENTDIDKLIQTFGVKLNFPVTQLVSSGVFVSFVKTKLVETFRLDKRFNAGANVDVTFTRSLNGSLVVQYRTSESTNSLQNYDEFSIFASLAYNFGGFVR